MSIHDNNIIACLSLYYCTGAYGQQSNGHIYSEMDITNSGIVSFCVQYSDS